ncbi:relaxase/mobilization nuclease domain-containing protein [Clostridium tyrobutyricum]|uniref:relaxase/mobilization nuclease domain-containing protein n=1 Tax=Clostridium tyrobutyricum TaxID=1519 RepID=UPI00242CD56E|nr:relaxase/mobilization nuclease domain-containing protein [Clostridium tyrobutyricum]
MAIIKAVNSKNSIRGIVNYVSNDKKTTEKLMLGLNCSNNPNLVIEEMNFTKKLYNKKSGRQYKHFVQSFNPKDKINPSKAIQIGRELAEKIFKGYEVFIVTHTDKKHVHNHFIVNSVNFKNGRKFQQSKNDLKEMKKINDEICEREGLSITKSEKDVLTSFNSKKYKAIEKSLQGKYKSYIIDLWHSVNMTLKKSTSKEEFIKLMEQKKYKVNWIDTRKNITFITPEGKKIRSSNLAKTFKNIKFTKEGMLNEFIRNGERLRGTGGTKTDTIGRGTEGEAIRRRTQKYITTVGEHFKNKRDGLSKQSGNEVTGEIQRKIREVKARTERATGVSKSEDRELRGKQQNTERSNKPRVERLDKNNKTTVKRTKSKNHSSDYEIER